MPITVDDYIAAQFGRVASKTEYSKNAELTLEEQAVIKLLELDIPPKKARSAVKKAIGGAKIGQPLATVAKRAVRIVLNMDSDRDDVEAAPQSADLRKATSGVVYDSLKQSGVIAPAKDEF
jgi:hypothetical protein